MERRRAARVTAVELAAWEWLRASEPERAQLIAATRPSEQLSLSLRAVLTYLVDTERGVRELAHALVIDSNNIARLRAVDYIGHAEIALGVVQRMLEHHDERRLEAVMRVEEFLHRQGHRAQAVAIAGLL